MVPKPIYHHAASSAIDEFQGRKIILSVAADSPLLYNRYQLISSAGYAVLSASDAAQALEMFGSWHPNLALLDYNLPGVTGDVIADAIKAHTPRTPVIMVVSDLEIVGRCSRSVDRFLFSNDSPEKLLRTISGIFESNAP